MEKKPRLAYDISRPWCNRDVSMLARMFKKRLRGYRAIGYDRDSGSGTQPRREVDNPLETRDLAEASDGDE